MKNVLQKLLISTLLISSMAFAAGASKSSSKIPGSESGGGGEPLVPSEFRFKPTKVEIKSALERVKQRSIKFFLDFDNTYSYMRDDKQSMAGFELRKRMVMNPSKVIRLIKTAKIEIKEKGSCTYTNKEHISLEQQASASAKSGNIICFSLENLEKKLATEALEYSNLEKILADLYLHEVAHLFGADEFAVMGLHKSLNRTQNQDTIDDSEYGMTDYVDINRNFIHIISNMLTSNQNAYNKDYLMDFCSTALNRAHVDAVDTTLEQNMIMERIRLRGMNIITNICNFKSADMLNIKKSIASAYFSKSEKFISEKNVYLTDLKLLSNGEFYSYGLGYASDYFQIDGEYFVQNVSDKIIFRNLEKLDPKAIQEELLDLRKDLIKLNQLLLDMII